MKLNPSPAVRRYVYGVATAAFALAVFYGWIEPEASPLGLALILAALNVPADE